METQKEQNEAYNDFPHENLMDENGIKATELSTGIQREIFVFDEKYFEAFIDGILTEEEHQELVNESTQIAEKIKKEKGIDSQSDSGSGNILAGLFVVGILSFFGIKALNK